MDLHNFKNPGVVYHANFEFRLFGQGKTHGTYARKFNLEQILLYIRYKNYI